MGWGGVGWDRMRWYTILYNGMIQYDAKWYGATRCSKTHRNITTAITTNTSHKILGFKV